MEKEKPSMKIIMAIQDFQHYYNLEKDRPFEPSTYYENIFNKYEKVRVEGNFNTITEWDNAARRADLSISDYFFVVSHYEELKDMYGGK